jgi:hypothetical protein
MELRIATSTTLHRPNADAGFVTWLDVQIIDDPEDDDAAEVPIGRIRAAIIHVGEAGSELYDALDADSGELEALYDVFFEENWFKEEFFHGLGPDMLYISDTEVAPGWKERNVDLAAVRRLCDTLGHGCELAVMEVEDRKEAERWIRMGFERSPTPEEWGLYHMRFAFTQPLVEDDDDGSFKVVPNLNPKQRRIVN